MNDILKDVSMAHRIVVKVGTSTLTYEHGTMNLKLIDRLSMVLSDLRNQGKEIILVSSGAQGIALGKLGLAEKAERYKGQTSHCGGRTVRIDVSLRQNVFGLQ